MIMTKEVRDFIALKERLTEASQYHLYCCNCADRDKWDSSYEAKEDLRAQVNKAIETLSKRSLAEIIKADFEACVDRKTAEPLLWICGLEPDELSMLADMWMDYSPDVDIGLVTRPNEAGRHVLYFSVESGSFSQLLHFNLFVGEQNFCDTLKVADFFKKVPLDENKEDPIDEEQEEYDYDSYGDHDDDYR